MGRSLREKIWGLTIRFPEQWQSSQNFETVGALKYGKNKIIMFYHCKKCLKERGEGYRLVSMRRLNLVQLKKVFSLVYTARGKCFALDLMGQKVAYDG